MKLSILVLAFFFFVEFGAALDIGGVLNGVLTPLNSVTGNSVGNSVNANEDPQKDLDEKFKELDELLLEIKESSIDKGNAIKGDAVQKRELYSK
ncbi:hypothetical protein GCK72_016000 [Caenorhabditis remanei]|uniref:Uncharacterized protein n=1 Tax=Caenorhabditis remanei TaxID=31234 RepID=A0A6A5GYR0_CAERE|nr:hypothetical protein GCK72_016000 [Caenorhabditis remanei]KAF1759533.1 hypothetical protein GCK72_016000 [Caenorhabditis remanei]